MPYGGKMVRSSAMTGKASTEERACGGEISSLRVRYISPMRTPAGVSVTLLTSYRGWKENPLSRRKRLGGEGAPRAERMRLLAQDRGDFVDGPHAPVFQRLAVCRCRNAHRLSPCVACLPLLRRLDLTTERPASVIILGVGGVMTPRWVSTLALGVQIVQRFAPAPEAACPTPPFRSASSPGRTHRDSDTSTLPPLFLIPILALVFVSVRAQTRRDGCRRRGSLLLRLLPLRGPPVVILDVRRAARMGLVPPPPLSHLGYSTCVAPAGIEADMCERARGGREGGSGVRTSSQKVDERGDAWSASRRRQASSLESPAEPLRVRQRGRRVWILGAVFYGSLRVEDLTRDGHSRWSRAAGRGLLGSHERADVRVCVETQTS
ncbi:hypothetical protein B0H13DRAFT_2684891 [Mycena leptocephala]|nr:hypothetical protein B0H13DRAFT_2684891 [Mycena leptocephala]